VNVLDENILASQRALLRRRRVPVRQIGIELGRKGTTDEEILSLLRELRRPTFSTRDGDFSNRHLCHERYCLVWLHVGPLEVAEYALRLLRHPQCNTQAKRMGCVIGVSPTGISVWRRHGGRVTVLRWSD
jgi:hypothetical protein